MASFMCMDEGWDIKVNRVENGFIVEFDRGTYVFPTLAAALKFVSLKFKEHVK